MGLGGSYSFSILVQNSTLSLFFLPLSLVPGHCSVMDMISLNRFKGSAATLIFFNNLEEEDLSLCWPATLWVPWEPVQGSTEPAAPATPGCLICPVCQHAPGTRAETSHQLWPAAVASSRAPSGLGPSLGQRGAMPCNQSRHKVPVAHRAQRQLQGQRLPVRGPRVLGDASGPQDVSKPFQLPQVTGLWGHPASPTGRVQQPWSDLHPMSCCDTSLGHHEPLQC